MTAAIHLLSGRLERPLKVPILWEDSHLMALDKPSGLLTSPDRYDPDRPNLMKLLHADITRGAGWARDRGVSYLANTHRLDQETSGVLLLAKTKTALTALADQFGSGKLRKIYAALVQGSPMEDSFEVSAPIGPHPHRPGEMRIDERHGKKARTCFSVRERFSIATLLTCQPFTGRTHQIRVHLRHSGFPVLGDSLYRGRVVYLSSLKKGYRFKRGEDERPLTPRVELHAEELGFIHPVTSEPLVIRAPWPRDLSVAVKYLRLFARP